MARCVDDVALLFGVLARQDRPTSSSRPVRLAVATDWVCGHPATDAAFAAAVSALRAGGVEVIDRDAGTPGPIEQSDELTVLLAELFDDLGRYLAARPGSPVHSLADVVAYENDHTATELAFFGHDLFEQAVSFGGRANPEYGVARARNLEWAMARLTAGLEGVDALIAPAYGPAWKSDLVVGGHHAHIASPATMAPAIAGWPIMSLPMGFVHELPVGLALCGRAHDEWRLLEVAARVESVLGPLAVTTTPTWHFPTSG
jgi:amidase